MGVLAAAPRPAPLGLFPVTPLWSVTLPAAVREPPAYDDQFAYLPLANGDLVARALGTGADAWTIALAATASPAVDGARLFAATNETLAAFRTSDGAPLWSIPLPDVGGPLVSRGGWVLAISQAGRLTAVRATDGHAIWRRDLGAAPHARLTIAGDRVYVPLADSRLVALAIEDGSVLWQHRLGGAPSEAAATPDRVYAGSVDNFLYCLDASDGRELWRWRTGADVIDAPVLDDDRVYFASLDNVLRALDRGNGAQRWKRALPLRPATGPVLSGSALLVGGLSSSIEAFATRDGARVGEVTAPGDLAAPLHVGIDARRQLPMLVVVSGTAAGGSALAAFGRDVEPAMRAVAPLAGVTKPAVRPKSR
jgi:outer membrane protein assembly factor BamB